MKRWGLVGAAVLAAHLGVLALVGDWKVLPRKRFVPPPTFGAAEATYIEPETGERVTIREFTVSTRLNPAPAPTTDPAATTARPASVHSPPDPPSSLDPVAP